MCEVYQRGARQFPGDRLVARRAVCWRHEADYTATATATGEGRNGHTESEDGVLSVEVRIPKEMGGPGGATNPEQLFAAGYAACFHSAAQAGRQGRRPHRLRRRRPASASGCSTRAASAWPSSSTSPPRTSTTTRPWRSSSRPTRCAPTATPPAATSRSSSPSSDDGRSTGADRQRRRRHRDAAPIRISSGSGRA